jgi:pyruvate/2-oxoglutarate dehydrogenase complex dihydrolipoamide acyltransferase (E2) component
MKDQFHNKPNQGYTRTAYPRARLLMVDGGRMARNKHTIHGLVEFDISHARELIRQLRNQTGKAVSFNEYFLACLGQAMELDKGLQAYRSWKNELIIFDDVDVNMLFEVEINGQKMIRPHIIRGVNHMTIDEIHEEVKTFQNHHEESEESKAIDLLVRLPGFLRRLFLTIMMKNPHLVKNLYGTVLVSSIGMFGTGSGWGIPQPNHTLQITLGGLGRKPCVVKNQIEVHEFISVTVSFDHDVVDGAPAARFMQRLKKLVENGSLLNQFK